ncbi:polysaccharide deacetylase family protein [Lichenifustis flavocetrariae]|uniref:Chitooligosaccharide deacetylase n=1 Tax=Lichenifustis flavocetrariae TaxID=2949735 RepID=A0AA41Z1Y1_9HYPH|nr:polysaccharide deacetylase family protein [Lichenifustis flavocetrariae]MCW6511340.1 polysaccharide deacetylase family protein [Lichenifustis flavocetrariae]
MVSRLRIELKHGLKLLLGAAGLLFRPHTPGLRVLFYHRVNAYPRERLGPISREISVTPAAFEQQLRHLASDGWRGISLSEYSAMQTGRVPLDPKAVLITFDDGYEDNLTYAAPLLARYGFPATVFVIAGFLGKTSGAVWPHGDPPEFGRFLDLVGLQSLPANGVQIGSHTLTHPRLTEIDDRARDHELVVARAQLETALAGPVTAFAYPEGDVDAAVERAVTAAGYDLAFTTVPGMNTRATRRTALRRTEVSASDGPLVFRLKLAGALDWLAFKESALFRNIVGSVNRRLLAYARPAGP